MSNLNWFFDELYFTNIYFIFGCNQKMLNEAIKDQFELDWEGRNNSWDGKTIEVQMDDGPYGIFIALSAHERTDKALQALCHECVHAANMILSKVGIKVNINSNDEMQAYLVGWLYLKCLEFLPPSFRESNGS